MSAVETQILIGYLAAGLGFLGVGFSLKLTTKRVRVSAEHLAIVSALGDGARIVLASRSGGGLPYRVAVGGQVFGFATLSGALEFIYEASESESVPSGAVKVHHPSLG